MALYNIVVQVIDKRNPASDAHDSQHPKTGDVIDILPATISLVGTAIFRDDHNFWRVLQVDTQFTDLANLLLPEAGNRRQNLLLQYRQYSLDFSVFSLPIRNLIASNPKAPISINRGILVAAMKIRPPRQIVQAVR